MKRLLIIGCGDIALRTIPLLARRYRIYALVRSPFRREQLRELGVTPVAGDLDDRASLARIAGLAHAVLHFAPPAAGSLRSSGVPTGVPLAGAPAGRNCDTRTQHLLAALSQGALPGRLVYISTSGVYGDCGGAWVDETRPLHPQTQRAQLRADAERQIRAWAKRNRIEAAILRVPGIYAADRLPLERLRQGMPAIVREEDGYTNHIHADDLARIAVAALLRAKPNRVYHASDDSELKMGDYFDAVADACGLPRVLRVGRTEALRVLPPSLMSFMNESRRLENWRMKRELNVVLRYPKVGADSLRGCFTT